MRKPVIGLLMLITLGALSVQAQKGKGFLRRLIDDRGGLVYVMTNASTGNEIVVFDRDARGRLRPLPQATVATGGAGGSDNAPTDPLGSQDSLVYDAATGLLFAVNAGDNTVAAFDASARNGRLRRTALVPSGGMIPVSVAVSEDRLYVLNAGGAGAVTTFEIGPRGQLTQLGVYELGLSNPTSIPFDQLMAPGEVGVDALARHLIVVNGGGREVLTAALDDDGLPVGSPTSTPTPGMVPFAFAITRHGSVLVAEAASGSVSAYDPPAGGPLTLSDGAVENGQMATCWILELNGFVYTTNTGSDNISLYRVSRTGDLSLVDAAAAPTGGAPADMTFAGGGGFLYTLNLASGDISGFAVDPDDGTLEPVETQGGLAAMSGIQGIAARDF